ncbi:interleukin-7 receptor subunit alpha-like protein [Lates japonicus]|uniref:Interleukin-7 receptor subunit alpha-like protein n=1 Tax=Lates japonicus TaxID=270547 RepID=A0AAD3R6F8_LATJO|nr:interleukin-7 receptor subunit alpha-like protein [Lates japonicus]
MPFGWRIAELLLLLLLSAGAQAQSGDGDADMEPRISCWSDITTGQSSLTCELLGGRNDNEDDEDNHEDDSIERMTLCRTDCSLQEEKILCVNSSGDTIRFIDTLVVNFNLSIHLKRGGKITTTIDLKKIVRPRSPHVWNVTFNQETNQATFHIRTPYNNDYLRADNQLFQLHIWTTGNEMVQNVSSEDNMKIDMEHLWKNTEYHVTVRSIPVKHLQGSWSKWSQPYTFLTPPGEKLPVETSEQQETLYTLIVCLIALVVVIVSVVFFWKNKIYTYMWPSIPHPKDTLVQICKPNKGLLLNFKPEVFSALKVYPMEKTEVQPCEETEPSVSPAAADGAQSTDPCSTQSSDCRSTTSVSTEELELSALLSRSSSDGEDSLQSINDLRLGDGPRTPQPERSSGGNEGEVFGVSQQEEAYVTMSSFYQIK